MCATTSPHPSTSEASRAWTATCERPAGEQGIALISALLVTMLMTALLVGFTTVVMSDQRYRVIDRSRNQAFYGASAGIEKLTADLGNLFSTNVAPTAAQLASLTANGKTPSITGVTFVAPMAPGTLATSSLSRCAAPNAIVQKGANGYSLQFCAAPSGNPTTASVAPIKTGPYEGLIAQQTPYQVDVTAHTSTGGEVHLSRSLESVSIPVFQFGMFSDVDLSFSAADDFDFGGRVHTNRDLYLAETAGRTLTLRDKVTAVREIIRQRLSNGVTIGTVGQTGTVKMATSPSAFRNLAANEGSVTDGPNSAQNEPTWHTVSLSSYNSWIRNGRTGVRALNLPLITVGGSNPDLVRRPVLNENNTNAILFGERMFNKASLRILLSDTAADIINLPGVTATAPVQLDGNWKTNPPNNGAAYGPVNATHPPIARSPGTVTAVITGGAASGAGRTLTIGAGVPAFFKVPDTLTVTAGANNWTLTGCAATKTLTTFTCTAVNPAHGAATAAGATVSGTVATVDGNIQVQTTTTANWAAGALSLTVATTMPFAPGSFFVGDQLISCTGYTANTLTNCTLAANVANNSTLTTAALSTAGTGTIGGYIKIERGNTDGTWTDVTMEILNYGIGAPNLVGAACGDPTPNAILRIQRLRDNALATCHYGAGSVQASTDFWPQALFDTREALSRDSAPGSSVLLGGVMYYIAIDAANLSRWFLGTAPFNGGTGTQSKIDNTGFTVFFSDRRNNRNAAGAETGDYGYEDFVNPGVANGPPNNVLDDGEDVNANGTLDTYGAIPNYNGVYSSVPPGAAAPLNLAARPTTTVSRGNAQVNRAILFRHALKVQNGASLAALGITGLTIVAENPVYIQGDWNANGTFNGAHAATAVIADAVNVLSNAWNDVNSFLFPYAADSRPRSANSYYRVAIISGKGRIFSKPGDVAAGSTFGTDGGAHSFLRMLEGETVASTVHYRGSMATFFYNRQANGPFKCCAGVVYGVPVRDYTFDTDFLNPALLPPNTPVFRDLNAVGFAQELRPGR
ncbi:MAG: pilus assembly PilX N-terminal domain-containing protein [Acidobacteria bacterium]|nr:pilus assembly PilX N-terminal domain-containing protein [Acidobacteriota bacterium]